jgi:hypothetical protein
MTKKKITTHIPFTTTTEEKKTKESKVLSVLFFVVNNTRVKKSTHIF